MRHKNIRYRIIVKGRVQGVGFRPTVYRYASELCLTGWVKNTAQGVIIEVEGSKPKIEKFIKTLTQNPPDKAQITQIKTEKIFTKTKIATLPLVTRNDRNSLFKILSSKDDKGSEIFIPPDMSICDDCLKELLDSNDRRYLYPFINCTNCGPRLTIINDVPYDRPKTTMHKFKMCPACAREYNDPLNRRFHAQPNACPVCGPEVELVSIHKAAHKWPHYKRNKAIEKTIELLNQGKIVAIKSLGGFHLACDARNNKAVLRLRLRKNRPDKPLAIMMPDIETVKTFCEVSSEEEMLLTSSERPIVLLKQKKDNIVSSLISPKLNSLGVMLPYTPLHYLLFQQIKSIVHSSQSIVKTQDIGHRTSNYNFTALVMTSGNRQDEPICRTNEDALNKLNGIADNFLLHNRDIFNRCDDSIVQVTSDQLPETSYQKLDIRQQTTEEKWEMGDRRRETGKVSQQSTVNSQGVFIRRARGYVPNPIIIKIPSFFAKATKDKHLSILACGAELKNTFAITRGNEIYISQYIGDLKDYETYKFYQEAIGRLSGVLRTKPHILVHDLHPDYLSTRYAEEENRKQKTENRAQNTEYRIQGAGRRTQAYGHRTIGIQHHRAHVASVLAEHGITEPVIGVAFDGVGLGDDSNLWGGEFFYAGGNNADYQRVAHFDYFPLPGGDESVENIWRIGYSLLYKTFTPSPFPIPQGARDVFTIKTMIKNNINSPLTSSVGRLFDGVASIIGLRNKTTYEAQAAMELEVLADTNTEHRTQKTGNTGYGFEIKEINNMLVIDWRPMIVEIVNDLKKGTTKEAVSLKFHFTLAEIILTVCKNLSRKHKTKKVVLSGGVFQNKLLTNITVSVLKKSGFISLINHTVPPNDGGISLGQAWLVLTKEYK